MLNETDHTNTGGNVYQCVILLFFFFELSLFLPSKWRIALITVGQTFLGLKELFYCLFDDFREKSVYAKIDQLRTCSSIPQTFFLGIVKPILLHQVKKSYCMFMKENTVFSF